MGKLKAGETLPKSFISNLNYIGNQITYNSLIASGMFNKTIGVGGNPKYGGAIYEYQPFYTDKTDDVDTVHIATRIYASTINTAISNDFSLLAEDGITYTLLSTDSNSWSVATINNGTMYFFRDTLTFKVNTKNKTMMTAKYNYIEPASSTTDLTEYSNFLLCYSTEGDTERVLTSASSTDKIDVVALDNAHHYVNSKRSAIVDIAKSTYYYNNTDRVLKLEDIDLGAVDGSGNKLYTLIRSVNGHYVQISNYVYDSATNTSLLYISEEDWKSLIEGGYPYNGLIYLNNLEGLKASPISDTEVQYSLAVLLQKEPNLDDLDSRNAFHYYDSSNPKDVLDIRDVNMVKTFYNNNISQQQPKYLKQKLRQFSYGTTEELLFDKYRLSVFSLPADEVINFFEGDSVYGNTLPCSNLNYAIAKFDIVWKYIKV